MQGWKRQITLEDVPEQYREMAEIMGMEPFLAMCEAYGGFKVYFPREDSIWRVLRDRDIRRRRENGERVLDIGRLYRLKPRQVQDILKRK